MGKKDIHELHYLGDNRRFADLINGVLFHGKQIVDAGELEEANGELLFPWSKSGKRVIRNFLAEGLEYHRQWKKFERRHQREGVGCIEQFV